MSVHQIDVAIEAPVNPTERSEAVADAVRTLFPKAKIKRRDDRITAETHDLTHVRERLFEQRILDTARGVFFDRRGPKGFSFELKKQAALQNVVNFAVGNPSELGEIQVVVDVHEPEVTEFIDYLAPATEDGVPPDWPE